MYSNLQPSTSQSRTEPCNRSLPDNNDACRSNDILLQENLLLRESCRHLLLQMDQLTREKEQLVIQLKMFHLMYSQVKANRNRIHCLLTSALRELEHYRRMQGVSFVNDGTFGRRKRHKSRSRKTNDKTQESVDLIDQTDSMSDSNDKVNNQKDDKATYLRFDNIDPITGNESKNVNDRDEFSNVHLLYELQCKKQDSSQSDSDASNRHFLDKAKPMSPNSLNQCAEFSKSFNDLTEIHDNVPQNSDILPNEISVLIDAEPSESKDKNDLEETKEVDSNDSSVEVEEATPLDIQKFSGSLFINFGSMSDCVREIRFANKPKQFLGIFFESALSNGVVIQQVVPNSVAASAGIRPGYRVLEICGINMRKANYRLADKILKECDEEEISIKVAPHHMDQVTSQSSDDLVKQSSGTESGEEFPSSGALVRKRSTLTRREAFKKKHKTHIYFDRKHSEHLMLYQTCHLTVGLPRRIYIDRPLAKIKLLGGNAVGIFVHSTMDELLANYLQTGDQLLEYNNFDLTHATAEDAAIELAKPTRNAMLVAVLNLETYNRIQEKSIGDSFYVRTEFSRVSINKSLEFKKGEILYIDNTLHEGKPGYWRAWKVDKFGQKVDCGIIPSKYSAECELLKQIRSQGQNKFKPFRFFNFKPYKIFFNRSKQGYVKLKGKTKVLASFSYSQLESKEGDTCEKEVEKKQEELANKVKSYQIVDMITQNQPRPVLVFGPYSQILTERLEKEFPDIFRQCTPRTRSMITMNEFEQENGHKDEYLYCTHQEDAYECISVSNLAHITREGLHPVIPVVANTVEDFHKQGLYPVVVELKFRSARHIKETVNKWNVKHLKVGCKIARAIYSHMLKLESEFDSMVDVTVTGNNLTFLCTQIKERVQEEQNKVIWSDLYKPSQEQQQQQ